MASVHKRLLGVLLLMAGSHAVSAQSYINQQDIEEVLEKYRVEEVAELPEVEYDYFVLGDGRGSTVLARNSFYKIMGQGDAKRGHARSKLVELLNRRLMGTVQIGDTLVVPRQFETDFRAYAPFPLQYPGAREFDKLFVIHKTIQAWAAYEHGDLVRWGIVNTGTPASPTPQGRFNFNWKTEYRISTLSPLGERWEMYWVFNFHNPRGIHVHQYPLPTGGPTSHGCVRLVETDAKWIYEWANPWQVDNGRVDPGSESRRIIKQGTTVLVIGQDTEDAPVPFLAGETPVLKRVELPDHPYDVPPGTDQQKSFDRLRSEKTGPGPSLIDETEESSEAG